MENQFKICPKCSKATSYVYHKHRYVCDECGWEEEIPEVDSEETEEQKLLRELFLTKVCKNYACGSQRCDGGPEWISGCQLFKKFCESIDNISNDLLKS